MKFALITIDGCEPVTFFRKEKRIFKIKEIYFEYN